MRTALARVRTLFQKTLSLGVFVKLGDIEGKMWGGGGERLLQPYQVVALPRSPPYLVVLHNMANGLVADFGFCFDCHSQVICSHRDLCLGILFLSALAAKEIVHDGGNRDL